MDKQKISRDQKCQNEYKDKLKAESRQIYGVEKCYASHKPYKGLIASHIKPYKLCVLENDIYSQFNMNNGLLLCKSIDDYFDKFLITFNEDGKIVCSEYVPKEIQEEFENYQLDSYVFNEERKNYMQIHRSIYYYKNYYEHESSVSASLRLENIAIPFFDCGIKIFNNECIVFKDGYWTICQMSKLKHEFIEQTGHKFKYYISNADFIAVFSKQKEYYVTEHLTNQLNCPDMVVDVENRVEYIGNDSFKISSTNFNVGKGQPKTFISLLNSIFRNDINVVKRFRSIMHCALIGKGMPCGVVMHNDISSIDLVFDIIKMVVGNYIYEYPNSKILYKEYNVESIPNCNILYFKNPRQVIDKPTFDRLVDNKLFPMTELNCNKYVVFIATENRNVIKNLNAIEFDFAYNTYSIDINSLVENEGSDILNWFVNNDDFSMEQIENESRKAHSKESHFFINEWLQDCCVMAQQSLTKASDLYDSFIKYADANNIENISLTQFGRELSKVVAKKRFGEGVFYMGIKIKPLE